MGKVNIFFSVPLLLMHILQIWSVQGHKYFDLRNNYLKSTYLARYSLGSIDSIAGILCALSIIIAPAISKIKKQTLNTVFFH